MAPQVATLSEELPTEGALVGSNSRVLAEMVPQVAALAEDGVAPGVLAAKVELGALGIFVEHADGLVPLVRNAIEPLLGGDDDFVTLSVKLRKRIRSLFAVLCSF